MSQVQIFFGSQTGTAECFSEEIRDEAVAQGINAQVVDLQVFTPEDFAACKIAVLVVATYGDGEPSDNAVKFHKWASDPRNNGALVGQRFTVMGLGDMNYSQFNNMGMQTDLNLERLGAKRVYRRGIGDDSQDIAADFQAWKEGGLWEALKKAIAEVELDGGFAASGPGAKRTDGSAAPAVPVQTKSSVYVFYGHEEGDGAAKDVCEEVATGLRGQGATVAIVQSLSDRKAVEIVKKLPKRSVMLVIVDAGPEGLCSAGRKLVRNMSLEMDSAALADKDLKYGVLTLASSKCSNSAAALKDQIAKSGEAIAKALDRAGLTLTKEAMPSYLDAGVEAVGPAVEEVCGAIARTAAAQAPAPVAAPEVGQGPESSPVAPAAPKVQVLCAGAEAREAGDALAAAFPGGATVEDAALASVASAAQQRLQVVLAVECAADGSLSDAGRGLAAQLGAAPIALKATLRQLRFALVVVAATDYGNAGERASANAALAEITRAAAPVIQALQKAGAGCVAQLALDLQDTNQEKLAACCKSVSEGFAAGVASAAAATNGTTNGAAPATGAFGTPSLRLAGKAADLPAEVAGEPAEVLSRFYFEASSAKVLKVRELRQEPCPEEGLSTAEVEIEATGGLQGYTLGGTFSLLPENDPANVNAALPLLSLTEADLDKALTFVPLEGGNSRVKKPFPTPCTIREALSRYCDLGKAPTKKMLAAVQPRLKDPAAAERVAKLLADVEALKLLQSSQLCCRMHEFWALLGVTSIDLCDFLLHCPRQKPREFTIASSPKAAPGRITLCVSLSSHGRTDLGDVAERLRAIGALPEGGNVPSFSSSRFFGACSRWLTRGVRVGDTVLARQRSSPLHLPDQDVPIVMVGAGAGVAPFRGFWEELRSGPKTAPAALFFGCRHPDKDWLFKEEMNGAVKLGGGCSALARMQVGPKRPLACLFPAFSRPGDDKKGQYVQDLMRAQGAPLKHWVEKMSGYVFICGSTAMGNAVLDALAEVLEGGRSTVEDLRKEGRIVAEMWG